MRDLLHRYAPLLGCILLLAAIWILYRQLQVYNLHDIIYHIKALPTPRLLLALLLTGLSYVTLSGYDALSLHYIRRPLAYEKMALAAFMSYAFGHNAGMTWLSSGSIRYRLYLSWGVSTLDTTTVVVVCNLTFWLGFCALSGSVFIIEPLAIPAALHLPFTSTRSLGILFFAFIGTYLALISVYRTPLRIRTRQLVLPSLLFSLAQIGIAALDLALAGGVLYVLLPPAAGVSCISLLGIFLLAYIAGMISQVPGGLGVFETVVLMLLPATIPAPTALGALLLCRAIYYLLPLFFAAIGFGLHELWLRKAHLAQQVETVKK
jgi:uncharacterized membrane protein YbhN (UPF0104 family)